MELDEMTDWLTDLSGNDLTEFIKGAMETQARALRFWLAVLTEDAAMSKQTFSDVLADPMGPIPSMSLLIVKLMDRVSLEFSDEQRAVLVEQLRVELLDLSV
ncbi:hypothetical protein GCM10009840_18160 [Pseudolysinimonas kribbensis]|uniref:Uncharacterized protein n=1 Tax=Pseudolysinimonas kribbensis TaxID=433641 RepID=A0ABQ6K4U8_9MICO|nr:hypothetical protein [Pseudolysinimonas kribbensis]GMA93801.1 hypothetical protein GCM10025881_06250 [Pseudolysinimonas kribbensis]